jgi:hypothetical protein
MNMVEATNRYLFEEERKGNSPEPRRSDAMDGGSSAEPGGRRLGAGEFPFLSSSTQPIGAFEYLLCLLDADEVEVNAAGGGVEAEDVGAGSQRDIWYDDR